MLSKRYSYSGNVLLDLNEDQMLARENVVDKISKGVYQFESVNCLQCGGDNYEPLSEMDRYGLYCPVSICRDCGLVQTSPRMTAGAYAEFYDSEYRQLYVGEPTVSEEFFKRQVSQGQKIDRFLSDLGWESYGNKKILEIGCGAGGILKYFRDRGAVVKGCDLGTEYLDYGVSEYGLDLVHGSIEDIPKSFEPDLVLYSHVFEHVLDPVGELEKLRSLCSSRTKIYIEVPGIKNAVKAYRSDFLRYLQNAHVTHFTARTLENILSLSGFKVNSINDYIQCYGFFSRTGAKEVVSDYSSALKVFQRLELIRKFYFLYKFSPSNIGRVFKLNVRRVKKKLMR